MVCPENDRPLPPMIETCRLASVQGESKRRHSRYHAALPPATTSISGMSVGLRSSVCFCRSKSSAAFAISFCGQVNRTDASAITMAATDTARLRPDGHRSSVVRQTRNHDSLG